jgi:hypothetical protein
MTSKPKSWRDLLPIHPAAELLPRMSRDELIELGNDIKANGLMNPIVIIGELIDRTAVANGHKFSLLDGISRLDAMEATGVAFKIGKTGSGLPTLVIEGEFDRDVPEPVITYASDGDPVHFVLSANLHRRHLTSEQKRELIAKLVKATPGKSNRQIAETVKVDHKTVASVRAEKVATGEIPQLTQTVGKDGKARKPPSATKPPPTIIAAADRTKARADRTPEPDAPPQPDDPDDLAAAEIDSCIDHVRETAEFIGRKCPTKLQSLREEIDSIFRKVIEARAPKISPANLGRSAQSCVSDEDLVIPMCLLRS